MSRMKNETRRMINEYYEEMAAVAEETAKLALENSKAMENMTVFPVDTDPLWDCWYDLIDIYEPRCFKDGLQASKYASISEQDTEQDAEKFDEYDVDDLMQTEEESIENAKDERRKHVSKRRKNAAMHKRKTSRNVQAIWDNYTERSRTDMHNWSFQKRKNDERIDVPKSQEYKADKILKRALKADAVPKELRKKIAEHLKGWHETVSAIMENRIFYERKNREAEAKVKQELDEKMVA